jgi:hypothetical protein
MILKVGDKVTCALNLAWGNVPAGTVGVVVSLFKYGRKCRVNFPVREDIRCKLYDSQEFIFDNPSEYLWHTKE